MDGRPVDGERLEAVEDGRGRSHHGARTHAGDLGRLKGRGGRRRSLRVSPGGRRGPSRSAQVAAPVPIVSHEGGDKLGIMHVLLHPGAVAGATARPPNLVAGLRGARARPPSARGELGGGASDPPSTPQCGTSARLLAAGGGSKPLRATAAAAARPARPSTAPAASRSPRRSLGIASATRSGCAALGALGWLQHTHKAQAHRARGYFLAAHPTVFMSGLVSMRYRKKHQMTIRSSPPRQLSDCSGVFVCVLLVVARVTGQRGRCRRCRRRTRGQQLHLARRPPPLPTAR